jgi:catechol 2,3-dioxygenase-like lactoylglutathione lyase family enzyme
LGPALIELRDRGTGLNPAARIEDEMDGKLWNIGIKTQDIHADIAYFRSAGGSLRIHETLETPTGRFEYAIVEFCGTRLFLTPRTVFEHQLPADLPPGLTHAVFEVADVDMALAQLKSLGTEVLIEPTEISAGLGSRRICFCRSPGGLVFEVMQIRESRI